MIHNNIGALLSFTGVFTLYNADNVMTWIALTIFNVIQTGTVLLNKLSFVYWSRKLVELS